MASRRQPSPPTPGPDSPYWDKQTKLLVITVGVVLLGLAMWQFQELINTLIIAGIIAYILNVPIMWLEQYAHLKRGPAIGIVFTLFALSVISLLVAAGVTIFNQGQGLVQNIQTIIRDGPDQFNAFMNHTLHFGTFSLTPNQYVDLQQILQQMLSFLQSILGSGAQFAGTAATTTFGWIGNAVFIYIVSIYFVLELPHMAGTIGDVVYDPGYRRDVKQLLTDTGAVWNSYLRGQITLSLIMGTIMTLSLSVLGVNNALAIGIVTALLDFVPFLGPGIAIGLSTLVALFQDSNWLGLSPLWFSVAVLIVGLIVQQIEGNWLAPRIVGEALGLHPLSIIIGAIIGGTLLGVVGVMLAAPVIATVKVYGTYIWHKLFDLPPFPAEQHSKQ